MSARLANPVPSALRLTVAELLDELAARHRRGRIRRLAIVIIEPDGTAELRSATTGGTVATHIHRDLAQHLRKVAGGVLAGYPPPADPGLSIPSCFESVGGEDVGNLLHALTAASRAGEVKSIAVALMDRDRRIEVLQGGIIDRRDAASGWIELLEVIDRINLRGPGWH